MMWAVARYVSGAPDQWKRLGEVAYARRLELDLSAADACAKAGRGLSIGVLSLIENGRQERYSLRTMQALARALDWTDRSPELVLEGGEPEPLDAEQEPEVDELAERVAALERQAEEDAEWRAKWQPYLDHLKGETDIALAEWEVRLEERKAGIRKPNRATGEVEAPRREPRGA